MATDSFDFSVGSKDESIPEQNEQLTDDLHANFDKGQLSLLGQDVTEIPIQLIENHAASTRRLDLSYNRMRSLEGLEKFIFLEELVLDNNEIDDKACFPTLEYLHTLTLNKNKITNLEKLLDNIRINLPHLTYLSLLGNTACPNQLSCSDKDEEDYQRYRYFVLYQLPNLKFLDSTPVKPQELTESQRVGEFMKIVRLEERGELPEDLLSSPPSAAYSPLPDANGPGGENPIGTYGKVKYVYYGRHSEGNRFIRNNDL